MPHISKHHSEEEGEGDDGEHCRVHFSIAGNAISMHDLLEGAVDLVCLEVGGWRLVGDQGLKDSSHLQKYQAS